MRTADHFSPLSFRDSFMKYHDDDTRDIILLVDSCIKNYYRQGDVLDRTIRTIRRLPISTYLITIRIPHRHTVQKPHSAANQHSPNQI